MPVTAVTGLSFVDTHNRAFDLAFTTASAGYAVSAKAGSGLSAPTTPTDTGWTLLGQTTATSGAQAVRVGGTDAVPYFYPDTVVFPDDVVYPDSGGIGGGLVDNDIVYTVAIFGWDGVSSYSSAATVDAHAIAPPTMLASSGDYALVQVTSDFDGLHVAVEFNRAADWDEGTADTRWETAADPDPWEVYDTEAQAELRVSPELFPAGGLPAGSSGRVVRLNLKRFYGIGRFRAYQG